MLKNTSAITSVWWWTLGVALAREIDDSSCRSDLHVSLLQSSIQLKHIETHSEAEMSGQERSAGLLAAIAGQEFENPVFERRPGAWVEHVGITIWLPAMALVAYLSDHVSSSGTAEKPRDGRWDLVKFWCMVLVVQAHLMANWSDHLTGVESKYHHCMTRFHMTSFSFVSGVFGAGAIDYDSADGKATWQVAKFKNMLRDLVLPNLTYIPVNLALQLSLDRLANVPFITDTWWYLNALFLWLLVTPVLSDLRYPLLFAGACSVLTRPFTWSSDSPVKDSSATGASFYFIFFVLGFVLGGGGLAATERSTCREKLEASLSSARSRAGALAVLAAFVLLSCAEGMPTPFEKIFTWRYGIDRLPSAWSDGGWILDACRICWTVLLMLSFVVGCFALPASEILSNVGSRTLYVYILHFEVIRAPSTAPIRDFAVHVSHIWAPLEELVYLVLAISWTLLLGSRLFQTLFHPFLQPQWLVDLLFKKADGTSNKGDKDEKGG